MFRYGFYTASHSMPIGKRGLFYQARPKKHHCYISVTVTLLGLLIFSISIGFMILNQ